MSHDELYQAYLDGRVDFELYAALVESGAVGLDCEPVDMTPGEPDMTLSYTHLAGCYCGTCRSGVEAKGFDRELGVRYEN